MARPVGLQFKVLKLPMGQNVHRGLRVSLGLVKGHVAHRNKLHRKGQRIQAKNESRLALGKEL